MTELKTLKDIISEEKYYNGQDTYLPKEILDDLRKEAIKWIKGFENAKNKSRKRMKKAFESRLDIDFEVIYETVDAKIEWIKNFFNLTDEEKK